MLGPAANALLAAATSASVARGLKKRVNNVPAGLPEAVNATEDVLKAVKVPMMELQK
jgi:hypothetical protein